MVSNNVSLMYKAVITKKLPKLHCFGKVVFGFTAERSIHNLKNIVSLMKTITQLWL